MVRSFIESPEGLQTCHQRWDPPHEGQRVTFREGGRTTDDLVPTREELRSRMIVTSRSRATLQILALVLVVDMVPITISVDNYRGKNNMCN